ncbi:hypothetical protein BDY19DRAFT_912651 [Irpex rosettiformis]|uniref:Uncharacterized protein n=1 Tax=Irpex rosettiformis TaxID=378272 RepID=A0ACB8UJD1_9APHY|nr:hypothetical protein BDY19DRAFT_912651 [Irpex rosettiformis]
MPSDRIRSSSGYADKGYHGSRDSPSRHYYPDHGSRDYNDVEMHPPSPSPSKRLRTRSQDPYMSDSGARTASTSSKRTPKLNDNRHHPYASTQDRSAQDVMRQTDIDRLESLSSSRTAQGSHHRGSSYRPPSSNRPIVEKSRDPRRCPPEDPRRRAPSPTPTLSSSTQSPTNNVPAVAPADTPHHEAPRAQPTNVPLPESPIAETPKLLLSEAEWYTDVPPDTMARYHKGKMSTTIEERRNQGLRPFFYKCGFEGHYGEILVAIFEDLGIYTLAELAVLCDNGLEGKLIERLGAQHRMPWFPRKCIEVRLQELKEKRKKAGNLNIT